MRGLMVCNVQGLKQKDPDNLKDDKPKAYLNYVFFDKQLKFVEEGGGVKQVDGEPNELETLSSGKVVAKKNGYVYVYTSNESSQDVLFDNLGVMQITGPVLEETHYYPFGLTMSWISTTAPLRLEGKRKFNGIEFNHKEFSDGSGLDLYTAKFIGLDPRIGRWWQMDPKPDYDQSPYAAMSLNPVLYSDFLGDTIIASTNGRIINNQPSTGKDDNFIKTDNPLPTVTVTAQNERNNNSSEKQSGFAPGIPISPIGFSPKPIDIPKINIPEVGIGVLGRILGTIGLVLLPVNYGQPSSDHLPPPILHVKDKTDHLKGGKQWQRDADIKQYPKDFQDWYHREYKPKVNPGRNATPDELEEAFEDCVNSGKPRTK